MKPYIPPQWLEKTSEEEKKTLSSFFSTFPENFDVDPFDSEDSSAFFQFVKEIEAIDRFYSPMGGILGYYTQVQSFLKGDEKKEEWIKRELLPPPGWDLREGDPKHLLFGLTSLPLMGEIYPLGGAGDRLSLICENTGEPLPAACLSFLGKNLLDGLLRDLEGREALFFKLFGKSILTPVALMTSDEKGNNEHIERLLEEASWFHRPKTHFSLFKQPQAPLISLKGEWIFSAPWKLAMKPGGHGLLWKLAREEGVFDWFEKHNRSKLLVRQINNPVAGLDEALLSFTGIGVMEDKGFGFLSCPRRVGAPEGVNLLIEEGDTHWISSVEYTEFSTWGIADEPERPGSPYSKFPSNTNILFGDVATLKELSEKEPFPGLLLNPKTKVTTFSRKGPDAIERSAGRLETLMQAIGNRIRAKKGQKELKSFLAFNDRKKTISPTKRSFEIGKGIEDTPEGAYADLLSVMEDLLTKGCKVEVSPFNPLDLQEPSFRFHYHPALGPPFSLIRQKIQKGKLHLGAELICEIGEIFLHSFEIQGSLEIVATNPLGALDEKGVLSHSYQCGKCRLEDVVIKNKGIDFSKPNRFWKGEVKRDESFKIILEGDSLFEAKGVTFEGAGEIVVPDGWHYRLTKDGLEKFSLTPNSPLYRYSLSENGSIRIVLA